MDPDTLHTVGRDEPVHDGPGATAGRNGAGGAPDAGALIRRNGEVFEAALEGHLVTDPSGVILEANSSACKLLYCPPAFIVGKPLGLLLSQECRATFYRQLVCVIRTGVAQLLEMRCQRAGRPSRDLIAMASPILGENGSRAAVRWLLRDITAARDAGRVLRAERLLLDSVIDAAEVIILVVDAAGRVVRSNPYLHAVSGYNAADLRGREWWSALVGEEHAPAARHLVRDAMKSGTAHTNTLPLPVRGGRVRSVNWSARGFEGENGARAVVVGHDVTDLEEAQRQALHAERLAAIGSMAAGLAHEARNALQRSQSCLSLLALRLKDNAEAMDLIGRIQTAQDDLHRLYEDVREYAAPLRIERVPCDLCEVWRQAWDDVSYRPGFRGAELHEEECGVQLKCVADPFHLKRVFRNIFENSLAAGTDPLRIRVHCSEVWLGQRSAVRVSLRDNGPGFPEGHSDELFEPFYTTKPRGTGLGLSICKRIVEAHGGTIEAAAGPGPGAEIIITLPRRTP